MYWRATRSSMASKQLERSRPRQTHASLLFVLLMLSTFLYETYQLTKGSTEKLIGTLNVVICMSICGDRGDEALISVKSALLWVNELDTYAFHFFTDDSETVMNQFVDKILQGEKDGHVDNVEYFFHTIRMSEIQEMFKLCSANRLLIPQELTNIEAYMYVDSDVIWLEDPRNLMHLFSDFNSKQEIGLAYEIVGRNKTGWYNHVDQDGRHFFGLNGLNAGVGLYRVRDPSKTWQEWDLIIKEHRNNLPLGDQDVLNEYLWQHQQKLYILDCQWNRRKDSACMLPRPAGILHGNRAVFHDGLKYDDEYTLYWNLVKAVSLEGFPATNSDKRTQR